MIDSAIQSTGFVVIGRNEGKRLERCLEALPGSDSKVVYVDSGSTDDSVALARRLGAEVVPLNLAQPFTAARARNAGFRRLLELVPDVACVQFIDGDCELHPEWIRAAVTHMTQAPTCAVVCGRLRERHPDASRYNRLCDMEWDGPLGKIAACGGIALMRVAALAQSQGFREDLIAGEEPELCVRLRKAGWEIVRLPDEMALHDAAMMRFSQWCRRTMRGGFASAQGAWLHGAPPERHGVRRVRSALVWGLGIPIAVLALTALLGLPGLLLLLIYPVQSLRLAYREGRSLQDNLLRGSFLVLGKFPEAAGVLKFHIQHRLGRRAELIEYK